MFINCSNHSSKEWTQEQIRAANLDGEIYDYSFPNVPSEADEQQIRNTAEQVVGDIMKLQPDAVMCQGEFTLTFQIVTELKRMGVRVVSACSERVVEERKLEDGTIEKISRFRFVKFREY